MAIKAQTKQTRLVLSHEQTEKAVQIYYAEGRKAAIEYLSSQGSKAPEKCWDNIRHRLQVKPQAKSETPEQVPTVKLTGPIKIETPEGNQVHVVEVPEDPQPVSKPRQPLMFDGYTVRCIEGKYGRFFWDYNYNRLDWTSPEGEEVSMSPQAWTSFCTEIMPKVMAILGVNP